MTALINEALVFRTTDVLVALAPLAAIGLAAVFAVAAVAKLATPGKTTAEFAGLGLPFPSLLTRIVPPAELAIGAVLLTRPAIGALAAAVVLLAFTVVLADAMRSGRSVTCGCLGPLSRRPISPATLARNGALLGLAALASTASVADGSGLARPTLEVVLATGTAGLLAIVGHQLLTMRNQIGRLWSVELAGEERAPDRRSERRQPKRAHRDGAVMNGAAS